MSEAACLVLTTVGDRAGAERLARSLVEERLAACVNLVPGVHSIYRWQSAVEEADEILLLIKTTRAAHPALAARISELHDYETPEVIVLDIDGGSSRYLEWLLGSVEARD